MANSPVACCPVFAAAASQFMPAHGDPKAELARSWTCTRAGLYIVCTRLAYRSNEQAICSPTVRDAHRVELLRRPCEVEPPIVDAHHARVSACPLQFHLAPHLRKLAERYDTVEVVGLQTCTREHR